MTWNQRATAHLEALAARNGIDIEWCEKWKDAEAWVNQNVVYIPKVRKPRDYLVGLHELGHCASRSARHHHRRQDIHGHLACESAAWAWAAENVDKRLNRAITRGVWHHTLGTCYGDHVWFRSTDPL